MLSKDVMVKLLLITYFERLSRISDICVYLLCHSMMMTADKKSINPLNRKEMENMTVLAKTLSNIAVVNNMTITRAKVIAHRTNSVDNGIVKAAMINELKTKLANGIAHFIFTKKNGEIREAWGTTSSNIAKAKTNGRGESRENYATTAYYDVEKGEWRSFRWETLIQVF